MKHKILILIMVILSFTLIISAQQQIYKIKPIVGKHSYTLQSEEIGYGIKKYKLCLGRIPEKTSEFYLPSNFIVEVNARPFSQPQPSNKLKINSQKTADGFLFVANGPQGNNLHLHLKKSASENSSFQIEINLTQGKKYQYKIEYVLNGYLLIIGEIGNYYEMIDLLSSNNYYLEALSMVDDELRKYQGDGNLNWWAEALVGIFGDLIDVEAIGQIDNNAKYFTQMFEGYSDSENLFSIAYWKCGEYQAMAHLFQQQFIILNSINDCFTSLFLPTNAKIFSSYLYCKFYKCPPIPGQQDICIMECMKGNDDGDGTGTGTWSNDPCYQQTEDCFLCKVCCSDKLNECLKQCGSSLACKQQCYSTFGKGGQCELDCELYNCVTNQIPCFNCGLPQPLNPD